MESKVQPKNILNKLVSKNIVQQSDAMAVQPQGKKRRAAFADLTNNGVVEFGNKKKCLKRDDKRSTAKVIHRATVKNVLQKPSVPVEAGCESIRTLDVHESGRVICEKPQVVSSLIDELKSDVLPAISASTSDESVEALVVALCHSLETPLVTADSPHSKSLTVPDEPDTNEPCDRIEWVDVDDENKEYPIYVTEYVNDIFEYYKQREAVFRVGDYMSTQANLSCNKRAILVDWLVEVQQSFELTHETLYMTVKMVDLFLDKRPNLEKDRIQLVGTAALSVACKFEEQNAPIVTDYVYICDDAYTAEEILAMEAVMLTTLGFDIGMPLSYTFLRRYAQCARVSIPTLTLARYILETSLLDYAYVQCSESCMAAASLFLAMRMIKEGSWDATVVHYTDFVSSDVENLVRQLNKTISTPVNKSAETIYNKYSHSIFHSVAKTPSLSEDDLSELFSPATL